jgi:hypothetical protein
VIGRAEKSRRAGFIRIKDIFVSVNFNIIGPALTLSGRGLTPLS